MDDYQLKNGQWKKVFHFKADMLWDGLYMAGSMLRTLIIFAAAVAVIYFPVLDLMSGQRFKVIDIAVLAAMGVGGFFAIEVSAHRRR